MTPIDQVGLGWRGHKAALTWVWMLYRRPAALVGALEELPRGRALRIGGLLYLHALLYLVFACFAGRRLVILLAAKPESIVATAFWVGIGAVFGIAGGVTLGIVLGVVLGIRFGVVTGLMTGLAVAILVGIAVGIAAGFVIEDGFAIAPGIVVEAAAGFIVGIAFGIAGGIAFGIAGWLAFGVVVVGAAVATAGIAANAATGIGAWTAVAGAAWIAVGLGAGIASLRAYYHPFALFLVWPAPRGAWYPRHPVAWDDLCSIPFWRLDRLLVAYEVHSPGAGRREIDRLIEGYPAQRQAALRASAMLVARDAGAVVRLSEIEGIVARLPAGDKGFLRQAPTVREGVAEISRLQNELDAMDSPALRGPAAQRVLGEVQNFASRVAGLREPLASEFRAAAKKWEALAERQFREVERGGG
jgi:hypothetical protein